MKFEIRRQSRLENGSAKSAIESRWVDPVCGMRMESWEFRSVIRWNGTDIRFCSAECKQTFQLFPGKFAHDSAAENPESRVG